MLLRAGPAEEVSPPFAGPFARPQMSSDVEGLDALLGGGIEQGSSTLVLGLVRERARLFVPLQGEPAPAPQVSRLAFIAAAKEAGIFVREGP